jgi:hypothetical protein
MTCFNRGSTEVGLASCSFSFEQEFSMNRHYISALAAAVTIALASAASAQTQTGQTQTGQTQTGQTQTQQTRTTQDRTSPQTDVQRTGQMQARTGRADDAAHIQTPAEQAALAGIPSFDELDKSNDGFVRREDVPADTSLAIHFDEYDVNDDGRLSRAEYETWVELEGVADVQRFTVDPESYRQEVAQQPVPAQQPRQDWQAQTPRPLTDRSAADTTTTTTDRTAVIVATDPAEGTDRDRGTRMTADTQTHTGTQQRDWDDDRYERTTAATQAQTGTQQQRDRDDDRYERTTAGTQAQTGTQPRDWDDDRYERTTAGTQAQTGTQLRDRDDDRQRGATASTQAQAGTQQDRDWDDDRQPRATAGTQAQTRAQQQARDEQRHTTAGRAQHGKHATTFAELDHNDTGFIRRNDLDRNSPLVQRFDQIDVNSDGRISRAEFDRWVARTGGLAAMQDQDDDYDRD